jgi:hypothetical protein
LFCVCVCACACPHLVPRRSVCCVRCCLAHTSPVLCQVYLSGRGPAPGLCNSQRSVSVCVACRGSTTQGDSMVCIRMCHSAQQLGRTGSLTGVLGARTSAACVCVQPQRVQDTVGFAILMRRRPTCHSQRQPCSLDTRAVGMHSMPFVLQPVTDASVCLAAAYDSQLPFSPTAHPFWPIPWCIILGLLLAASSRVLCSIAACHKARPFGGYILLSLLATRPRVHA